MCNAGVTLQVISSGVVSPSVRTFRKQEWTRCLYSGTASIFGVVLLSGHFT